MAKRISATLYTNRKGAERVGLQMGAADARLIAGFEGDTTEARNAQIALSEALLALFAEGEQTEQES